MNDPVACEVSARRLLTYAEASERFGININTLYALVHQDRIPHVRLGRRFVRFVLADVEHWLASMTHYPAAPKVTR